jgi:hypothetical protein
MSGSLMAHPLSSLANRRYVEASDHSAYRMEVPPKQG